MWTTTARGTSSKPHSESALGFLLVLVDCCVTVREVHLLPFISQADPVRGTGTESALVCVCVRACLLTRQSLSQEHMGFVFKWTEVLNNVYVWHVGSSMMVNMLIKLVFCFFVCFFLKRSQVWHLRALPRAGGGGLRCSAARQGKRNAPPLGRHQQQDRLGEVSRSGMPTLFQFASYFSGWSAACWPLLEYFNICNIIFSH